jgi:ABC-type antimicrobial peptide transport system permease subunit
VSTLYHAATPGNLNPLSLIVRVQGVAPESFAGRLRGITTSLDPTLRLYDVLSVAEMQRQEQRTRRLMTLALTVATLSVLLFSAAGIHALMSFTVANRRKEIGIRTALGAHPRRILAGIFSRALRQLGAGVAVGCLIGGALMVAGGATAARAAVLLLTVALLMLAVGLLAALGPARRGLRIQPMEALREG